jgi:branched-chain amino acid transport system substrate-binding protein
MILAFTACGGNGSGQTSGGAASGGDQGSGSVAADNTPIYIGMINSITGNYADFGVGNQWSANRAVEEINANGGVAGRRLELVFNDDEGDPTVSTTLAQKVVDDERILGLVGSFTTACSTVIAEVIDGKLCQVSGSSSSRVYTDTTDWAFSVFGLIETESRFMCRYVVYKYLGNPTVGALYSDTDFSHSSYDAFVDQAARDGVNIVDAISYSPTETDFSSIITKMQLSKPEVIVQFGTEGGINLINQIRSVGWDVPVCTFSKTANMLEQLGGNAEGQVVLSRWEFDMSNSFEAEFYNDFISDLGYEPLLQTASSYDIVYMYKQVIEELTAEGAPLTRQAVRDKIENIAFDGLTGHVVFDSGGMVERGCFIYQVENGEFVKKTDYDYIDRGYE